jgi:hypothetical protein
LQRGVAVCEAQASAHGTAVHHMRHISYEHMVWNTLRSTKQSRAIAGMQIVAKQAQEGVTKVPGLSGRRGCSHVHVHSVPCPGHVHRVHGALASQGPRNAQRLVDQQAQRVDAVVWGKRSREQQSGMRCMATTTGKRQWLGHHFSVHLSQGDKRQATTSDTRKKMHDSKVDNTRRRRVAAVARVAWPRLGISGSKAGQVFRQIDGGHDKGMYSTNKLWLLMFYGIHD